VRVNCEQNSVLYRVRPAGQGACHTKYANGRARSGCYYRRLTGDVAGDVAGDAPESAVPADAAPLPAALDNAALEFLPGAK